MSTRATRSDAVVAVSSRSSWCFMETDDARPGRRPATFGARFELVVKFVSGDRRLTERVPLAVASSSNRTLIDLVLRFANLEDAFVETMSSEEVRRDKPAPTRICAF